MEEALAVQVAEAPGDVQGQAQAHAPRQVHLAAQQLLQVPAVDVLKARRGGVTFHVLSHDPNHALASYLCESVELPLVNTHSDKPEKQSDRVVAAVRRRGRLGEPT